MILIRVSEYRYHVLIFWYDLCKITCRLLSLPWKTACLERPLQWSFFTGFIVFALSLDKNNTLPCIHFIFCVVNPGDFLATEKYIPWWRHQMETFSALLALCAGNSPVTGKFHAQRPVRRSFDVFFDLRLNKRLSKQSWGWRFETPSIPLWRYCHMPL